MYIHIQFFLNLFLILIFYIKINYYLYESKYRKSTEINWNNFWKRASRKSKRKKLRENEQIRKIMEIVHMIIYQK